MSYLNAYGKKRRFQEGVAPAAAPVQAGPEQGGQEEEILALAQATVGGDQAAAAQLGAMLAPMILQEVQAGGGGEEEMAPQEAQPVFKGGKFVGTIFSNFKYTLKLVPLLV
jgi:hypothetical protein